MGGRHRVKRTFPSPYTQHTNSATIPHFILRPCANAHEKMPATSPTCPPAFPTSAYGSRCFLSKAQAEKKILTRPIGPLTPPFLHVCLWEICAANNNRGPEGTPYEGGIFPAVLSFPQNYPDAPPSVKFSGQMFHPNSKSFILNTGQVHEDDRFYCVWEFLSE